MLGAGYFSDSEEEAAENDETSVVHVPGVSIQGDYMTKKEEDNKVLKDEDIKTQQDDKEYFEEYFEDEKEYIKARTEVSKHQFHPRDSRKSTCVLQRVTTGVARGTNKLNAAIDSVPGGKLILGTAALAPMVFGGPVVASVGATASVVQVISGNSHAIQVGAKVINTLVDTTPNCLHQFKAYTVPAATSAAAYATTATKVVTGVAHDVYCSAASNVYNKLVKTKVTQR